MGAQPWEHFVPFQPSVGSALDQLRRQVFASGQFNGSDANPSSIEEAIENADADSTRSILDISEVGLTPDFCTVCPLPDGDLERLFGTTRPTRQLVRDNTDFYEDIERGQGVYIIVYKDGEPSEYFFGGYSFD